MTRRDVSVKDERTDNFFMKKNPKLRFRRHVRLIYSSISEKLCNNTKEEKSSFN